MISRYKIALAGLIAFALFGSTAIAEDSKQLKTVKNKSVMIGNFVNARSDCSSNPGPDPLPALREKPTNGIVRMQIVVTDVEATANCPARKVPSLALIYTPKRDFIGTDYVQVEVETGNNNITALSYRIIVKATTDSL